MTNPYTNIVIDWKHDIVETHFNYSSPEEEYWFGNMISNYYAVTLVIAYDKNGRKIPVHRKDGIVTCNLFIIIGSRWFSTPEDHIANTLSAESLHIVLAEKFGMIDDYGIDNLKLHTGKVDSSGLIENKIWSEPIETV